VVHRGTDQQDLMHTAEIKDLVRDAYRHVPPTTAAVAPNLYSDEDLALVPQSAINRALGVANHLRRRKTPGRRRRTGDRGRTDGRHRRWRQRAPLKPQRSGSPLPFVR
jgi:hypothetical protein